MEKWKLTWLNHKILKSLKNWQCQVFLEEGEDINEKAYLENFSKISPALCTGWLSHPYSRLKVYSLQREKQISLDWGHGHGHFIRNGATYWTMNREFLSTLFSFGSQNARSWTLPFTQEIGRVFCEESYQLRGKTQKWWLQEVHLDHCTRKFKNSPSIC